MRNRLIHALISAGVVATAMACYAQVTRPAAKERWIHPAVQETDAIIELLSNGECDQAQKRLEDLRPQIEYLASLDPRD